MNQVDTKIEAQQEFQNLVRRLYGRRFANIALMRGVRTRAGIEALAKELKVEVQV